MVITVASNHINNITLLTGVTVATDPIYFFITTNGPVKIEMI